jgi:hypothetical protein
MNWSLFPFKANSFYLFISVASSHQQFCNEGYETMKTHWERLMLGEG